MEAYSSFAQVYDLFMEQVEYDEWLDHIHAVWKKYGITPKTIMKPIADLIEITGAAEEEKPAENLRDRIRTLEEEMLKYAKNLEFEKAAKIRDTLKLLYEENQ